MIDSTTHRDITAICYEVGYVTISWAAIDALMDVLNLALKRDFGGHPSWTELPRTRLNSKVKCARACLRHITAVAPLKERGLDIVDQIDLLSEERHWLIHGAAARANRNMISIKRIFVADEVFEERTVTLKDIALFGDVSVALNLRLADFLAELNILSRREGWSRTPS